MSKPPEPPIHKAARLGDIAALDLLVSAGIDINARTDLEVDNGPHLRQLTPLMVAARSIDGADADTLHWLLSHGADRQAESEGGETAAWYTAGKGGRWDFHEWRIVPNHADRLRVLLDAGSDVNETNFVGQSLLVEACEAGDPSRVRLLLQRGAYVDSKKDQKRNTSFITDHLTSKLEPDDPVLLGVMRSLTPAKPDQRPHYSIPLFAAALSGSCECVKLLLEAGANLAESDDQGRTVLMYAGSKDVVKALVARGARVDERTPDGDDVLSVVLSGAACNSELCSNGKFEVARELISLGANLHGWRDSYGHNRLYDAAFSQDEAVVRFLLDCGCNPLETSESGATPLHAICWHGEYECEETNHRCERIIRMLVAAGVSVDARNEWKNTPLHEAVDGDWENETAVRTLLSLGAMVDPLNDDGCSPLMKAAGCGSLESVRILLDATADPTIADNKGNTALTEALSNLTTWQTIASEPPDVPDFLETTPEQMHQQHTENLAKAEELHQLILKAVEARVRAN